MEPRPDFWMLLTVCIFCLLDYLVQHVAVSSGSGKNDLEKMSSILEAVPQVKFICLDVANGYSEHFVEFVKLVRAKFPEHTIMVGLVGPSPDGEAEKSFAMGWGAGGVCAVSSQSFWHFRSRRLVENWQEEDRQQLWASEPWLGPAERQNLIDTSFLLRIRCFLNHARPLFFFQFFKIFFFFFRAVPAA